MKTPQQILIDTAIDATENDKATQEELNQIRKALRALELGFSWRYELPEHLPNMELGKVLEPDHLPEYDEMYVKR